MSALANDTIRELLLPFVRTELPELLINQLSTYLDLLIRWNARVSLTSIRTPEEMVQRHFGESLFTAEKLSKHLKNDSKLLDFGSGAGFPGLPIQLYLPEIHVTLAESQARKVAFLREAIRTLHLKTAVWPQRVEDMQVQRFDVVTLRAVEQMAAAVASAELRVHHGGYVAALVGREIALPCSGSAEEFPIPESDQRRLVIWQIVPRGTIV